MSIKIIFSKIRLYLLTEPAFYAILNTEFTKRGNEKMLYANYNNRLLEKLDNAMKIYHGKSFVKVLDAANVKKFVTKEHLRKVPTKGWEAIESGEAWGGRWMNMWLRFSFKVPAEAAGKPLYMYPDMTYREGLLFIDGTPLGIFAKEEHAYQRITSGAEEGTRFEIATEFYAGHPCIGEKAYYPYGVKDDQGTYMQTYTGVSVCTIDEKLWKFSTDVRMMIQMAKKLPRDNSLGAKAYAALEEIYELIAVHPAYYDDERWRSVLDTCVDIVEKFRKDNTIDTPTETRGVIGLIGHSHMDSAWLWPYTETIRKCARTYANAMHLMEVWPEYKFIQSSALHSEWMKEYYPAIFEEMKKRVAEGRYEPNGGVYVECDCNITSGETMIRQFLKGQMFTRENFNYTADIFWLPDTFGYSAAIPQIMKGCCVKYFNTTKIGWNDLNQFPLDTFLWRGIDGSEVLTHFNCTHGHPDAESVINIARDIKHPEISNKKFYAYGYGDGGGGPFPEMIEEARFIKDLDGMPETKYCTASEFMNNVEKTARNLPVYTGELYLELHRGTLTQMHDIKRNNRKAELAMRDTEFFNVVSGEKKDPEADRKLKTLLKNQFHDILPGSSINEVYDDSRREMSGVIGEYKELTKKYAGKLVKETDGRLTVFNTLSFERNDDILLENVRGGAKGAKNQKYTDVTGKKITAVGGVNIPAFAAKTLELTEGYGRGKSAFTYDGKNLETPFACVVFDDNGAIASFIDKKSGRQLRKENGEPLNTFWFGEDVPINWDNWDIDADTFLKLKPEMRLMKRELVSEGSVQLVIRSEYAIGAYSKLKQDMIFHANSAQVDFHTIIDWDEKHALLKAGFDVDILANTVKNEIQYGHIERPTTRNNSLEDAKYEICNHKWTDISESRFGVAILNDCKYGISVENGNLRLSLHRGGMHPDTTNDKGHHEVTYSLLPHEGTLTSENVIRPAYMLNVPAVAEEGEAKNAKSFLEISAPNVICEAVKPAENEAKAFVVRLYECERNRTCASVKFAKKIKKAYVTNMLEDIIEELPVENNALKLDFRPFEIKTVLIEY